MRLSASASSLFWILLFSEASSSPVVSLEELLTADKKVKAYAAVDEGNRAIIRSLDCGDDWINKLDEVHPDWHGSGLIAPEMDCPELLEHPEFRDRVSDIEKAISTYNLAVGERARKRGYFSVYGGTEVIEGGGFLYDVWRMTGGDALEQIAKHQSVRVVESQLLGIPEQWLSRLYVVGHLNVDVLKKNLDTSVWKPSSFPWELLEAMHWYVGGEDACFLGKVNGYPAYLLLRKDYDLAVLVVALTLRESAESESLKR